MAFDYQVVVIGAGPGGYVCGIRLAQLGIKCAVVEKQYWGGTCLNVGCIPSKVLLDASHLYHNIKEVAPQQGIVVGEVKVDLEKLNQHKLNVVKRLTGGVKLLLEKNGAELIFGAASFADPHTLEITEPGGKTRRITAEKFVIATGSTYRTLPGIEIDGKKVISSDQGIDPTDFPQRLLVIGGGYIGMELGSVYNALGAEVVVVEFLPEILAILDQDVRKEAAKLFKRQGIEIRTNTKVTGVKTTSKGVKVTMEPSAEGGFAGTESFDKVLVAVGRVPYTDSLALDKAGVRLDEKGFVVVDEHLTTSQPHIYAIGDVIGGSMLAHKASHEGYQLAELLAGNWAHFDFTVPAAVFTFPEIAYVGLSEEEAREKGHEVKTGKFSFGANGRALSLGEADGFVKVIGDAKTDELLGVHIIGPHASDLINEATMALLFGASCEDFQAAVRIHPTLGEAVHEAALGVDQKMIHAINR